MQEVYTDACGHVLDNGKIYVGAAGLEPQSNPIPVFLDPDMTIAAVQPATTVSGYTVFSGNPVNIFVADENVPFSIKILDSRGELIYSNLEEFGYIWDMDEYIKTKVAILNPTFEEVQLNSDGALTELKNKYFLATSSATTINVTLNFMASAPVGYECRLFKIVQGVAGFNIIAPAGMTISGYTGVFGEAITTNGCSLTLTKISSSKIYAIYSKD